MTTFKATVKKPRSDGFYTVYIRITHQRKSSYIKTNKIVDGERKGNDTILFGIVVGLAEDEYGYISLNELSEVEFDLTAQGLGKLQVRQQENFTPMPLKNLQDFRLQRFLARFED